MKFIRITSFGNEWYINTRYIKSVGSIEGKTRICTAGQDSYWETDTPIDEIIKKIQMEEDNVCSN